MGLIEGLVKSTTGKSISQIVREKIVELHGKIQSEVGEPVSVVIGNFPDGNGGVAPNIAIMSADLHRYLEVYDPSLRVKTTYLSEGKINEYLKT
jgi:hypothetical protein